MIPTYHIELSIVMPIFNRKDLVRIMIDSIIANTYQNWELLAIDDGSTDGTFEMLQEYAQQDTRIKPYIRTEKPKGAQTCRNLGLSKALGKYIIFFDSDDYITPTCLDKRVESIKLHPEMDFLVFPHGIYEELNSHNTTPKTIQKIGNDLDKFLVRTWPFLVCTNIYKTETLRTHNITWDTNLLSLQDSDFNVMVLLASLQYDYIDVPIDYYVRMTNNGHSVSKQVNNPAHFASHIYLLHKWYNCIRKEYGNRKNEQLYDGIIGLLHFVVSRGNIISKDFYNQLLQLIEQYDIRRAKQFNQFYRKYRFFSYFTFLPMNIFRRIVFFQYLLKIKRINRL